MKAFAIRLACAVWMVLSLGLPPTAADECAVIIEDFDTNSVPKTLTVSDAKVALKKIKGVDGRALRVRFGNATKPGITLRPSTGSWDWSEFAGMAVDVANPQPEPVEIFVRIESIQDDGKRASTRFHMPIPADGTRVFTFFFTNYGAGAYWGMRGVPVLGPVIMLAPGMSGFVLDSSKVTAIQIYLNRPGQKRALFLDNIRVFRKGSSLEALVPFPFVDRFGQYRHGDWPGKINNETELIEQAAKESAGTHAELPGRDRFGGWADGPQLDATGWFRTEKVDGKWWLVTPAGHLFFSLGIDCVHHGDSTWIDGRDNWFEWAPAADGPFKSFVSYRSGAKRMAGPIGGEGRLVSFYAINLKRKYGEQWRQAYLDTTSRRLRAWGFNTIGNWSGSDVQANCSIPFVVAGNSSRKSTIETSSGFWRKTVDVFDPVFATDTDTRMAELTAAHASNPLVLGYFIDNEETWQGIPHATLSSPSTQPARQVFVDDLKAKYATIERLNEAWDTDATDWDALRMPRTTTAACTADSAGFTYRFGRRYFETVRDALRKHAPNQLYLGCRFSRADCPEPILKACAEVADVISINAYTDRIAPDAFTKWDKPVIIGEFHFGALDRGMFHPGLRGVETQRDRADAYVRYVRSVAANPCFVGCHWFQYIDQPLTGRSYDGENYNIGFVSVADVPYAEMVESAKRVHAELYTKRAAK
ncbi:MAG: hypothetical protein GWP08_07550 [Nitrospiraceae bacterium]|nr:hypothetical protein [Nitrospiraceae bacterium]